MSSRGEHRILQITTEPFPPEIRVVKEGVSLAQSGYQSAVLCPPIPGRPARERWRGIEVFRPPALAAAASVFDKMAYNTVYFSPAWFRAIRQVLDQYDPHVLHVHDIWLARTALFARRGQRLVIDLHENMPAAVVEYLRSFRGVTKVIFATFKNRWRVFRYERAVLRRSDRVLVVVEEARDRVRKTHRSLDPSKVVNVENLESRDFLAAPPTGERPLPNDHCSVLYIGGFGPHRGIDTLIRAMRHLKDWKSNTRLYLIGARESVYVAMLRTLIEELDIRSHVDIVGWVPSESVLGYIRSASIGAVPHHSNMHTDTTIPHKLFQYMIAGTPVLVSTSAPLARTVRAAGSGVIFSAGDPLDCARRIQELEADPERRARLGVCGRNYVLESGHNWEQESAPELIATYDELLGISTSAAGKLRSPELQASERQLIECPLCGGGQHKPWASENGYEAVKCADCALIYVNPRPPASSIDEAVRSGAHNSEAGNINVVGRYIPSRVSHYRRMIAEIFSDVFARGKPVSWLDVGAGFGEVVEAVQAGAPPGSRVVGIEPMRPKTAWAQAQGIPVQCGYVGDVTDRYAFVSLINVFSHIPDFAEFLLDLKRVLLPGGELLIETGNASDIGERRNFPDQLTLPDHLVFAGESQLHRFLQASGFEIVSIKRVRMDPPSRLVKNVVKRLLGRPVVLKLPYTSPARTLFIRARLIG